MSSGFKTFVFFDLEASGLPEHCVSRITELALYACSKEHLLNSTFRTKPRVLHKLVLCLNPNTKMSDEAEGLSKLSNALLSESSAFDEQVAELIVLFLKRLPKPICLVAHSGFRFDFPLLKKQLNDCNVVLSDDIRFIDTFEFFNKYKQGLTNEDTKKSVFLNRLRLDTIYERIHSQAVTSTGHHTAGADCITLMKCVIACRKTFVEFAEKNAKHMNSITTERFYR